jgi:hypothetical protein
MTDNEKRFQRYSRLDTISWVAIREKHKSAVRDHALCLVQIHCHARSIYLPIQVSLGFAEHAVFGAVRPS